jgi:hypothetical protein
METVRKILQNNWFFLVLIACGLDLRLGVASLGHNYDMESWFIVADIAGHHGNVYAETARYNYGPIWFSILHCLDVLAGHRHEVLRYLIAAFLSLVDLGIFLVLCRRVGRLAGVLFFFNPVSILITAYYCQFDNLAILLGLWSIHLFGDDFDKSINGRKLGGLLILGLSLMTKHVFFLFPIWLAVKQKGHWQKTVVLSVPVACFLLGFVPYWAQGAGGITENVFGYCSFPGGYFYYFFDPPCFEYFCERRTLWYGLLVLLAFVCRTRNSFESLLIYTGALVAFEPVAANQYLAIPVALASVFPSTPFFIYTAISTFHLCSDVRSGPRLWAGLNERSDRFAICALCCALVWLLWRPQILGLFRKIGQEIELQIGRTK